MTVVKIEYMGKGAVIRLTNSDDGDDEVLISSFITTKAKAEKAEFDLLGGADVEDEFDGAEDYFDELNKHCNTK